MKVLVACEYSGRTRSELIALGHDVLSVDLLPSEDGSPNHIIGDVFDVLKNNKFDLMIAHPPCTYLTNSGVVWLHRDPDRWEKMREGAEFFKALLNADVPRVAIENPIMHKYAVEIIGRRQNQVVQPWQFGHMEKKAICFWLRGVKKLEAVTNLKAQTDALPKKDQQRLHYLSPGPNRWKERSRTYNGVAAAMARQWAGVAV